MQIPPQLRHSLRARLVPAACIGVLVLVALGTALSLLGSRPVVQRIPSSASVASSPSAGMYVHVTGAVHAPGVITIATGARVFDVIAAAGGCASDADQSALNLAREVRNGEQIVVPRVGELPSANSGGQALLNLNTADASALDALPHVGPALAARIITYRTEHGGFQSVDELAQVAGIGSKKLADITPLVTV
ncbi:MAG: helix-hairpin-helix domain-containing protein [Agromyces sp.]